MNRSFVGRVYPEQRYRVEAEVIHAYARAINEDNPSFIDSFPGGDLVAPPLFPAVYHPRALSAVVGDPELGIDFTRTLHGEQDMHFHSVIRPNDTISTRARIEAIEETDRGEALSLALESTNQDGQPVETTLLTLLMDRPAIPAALPDDLSDELRDPMMAVTQQIDADQTWRYAEASGDRSRIHLDPAVARRAGLPGVTAHALCTMAIVSKALIDHLGGGEPSRLARMGVRFAYPAFPGQKIETRIEAGPRGEEGASRHFRFETWSAGGEAIIRGGRAEVRPESA